MDRTSKTQRALAPVAQWIELQIRRLLVRFPVRAHARVVGCGPAEGPVGAT